MKILHLGYQGINISFYQKWLKKLGGVFLSKEKYWEHQNQSDK
jgi:hypothetical protein